MSRRTGHATDSAGENNYPSLVNHGYVSDYFLAYRLESGLTELYKRWTELERDGQQTARSRTRGLSSTLAEFRTAAVRTVPDDLETTDVPVEVAKLPSDAVTAQRQLCGAVGELLGWNAEPEEIELTTGATVLQVQGQHVRRTSSGTLLIVLPTVFADDPAAMVSGKQAAAGTLLDPVQSGGKAVAVTALEAAQAIFTAENAPDYLLLVGGAAVVLLDRQRWGEGVYLGANLDEAASRNDTRAKGELAVIAALFSSDSIDPGSDAQSTLVGLINTAANESTGVSKDLRHGVRRSVELLAKAAVEDLRFRQKKRWQDIDADALTRECLRYLYRIIVLLYAEARPELGIVPADDPDYQAGYSIARLRDISLNDLFSAAATDAVHMQRSLAILFRLVDRGYQAESTLGDSRSLEFPGLKSKLFGADSCPTLDRARLPDSVLQQVLVNLCFTPEQRGRKREAVSYATLGINQLGAVYEGLMAYSGFLTTEEVFEIAREGKSDEGTWLVPIDAADEYPEAVFLKEAGPDGEERRVRYREGDFVFRLAGRDRQRSASFYTPEVLTEFTVRHALDVYEEEHPDMRAEDWLSLTVCEPALGSGAFANEAVTQLATRYLKAAQQERGETIDPDKYQLELQKAKAHFAINQTYGVDLNGTAVELAEVSLWLNVMHPGLQAPRFDARLKRGNSLIGARRATYSPQQVLKAPWKGTSKNPVIAPTDQPLHAVPFGALEGIHHFLVPGDGWGAAADAREIKGTKKAPGLAGEWSDSVREWRKQVQRAPSSQQLSRLKGLARRVEQAWAQSAEAVAERLMRQRSRARVWGAPSEEGNYNGAAEETDTDGPLARLKLVMDAWCALWLWAPTNGTELPSLSHWIDALELLLGRESDETGMLFTLEESAQADSVELSYFGRSTIAEVLDRHPWLRECQAIAASQAFFHWELELSPIFAGGGFDLQVGNPPWVRPTWNEPASLAEHDPWWGITDLTKTADRIKTQRTESLLEFAEARASYLVDRAENAGLNALYGSDALEPVLRGVQTNLYMLFMTNTWRRANTEGVIGLVHPESHFVDPKGGLLRENTYRRIRRHWQFANELFLFADVHHVTEFGVHIYAAHQEPQFVQAVNLLTPSTADRSLVHDGTGETPAIQYPEGGWDLRPHAERIVRVDIDVLKDWVALFDPPGTEADQSRLMRPLTQSDAMVLSTFSKQPVRLAALENYWTSGFHEKGSTRDGTIGWATANPPVLEQVILQGPHILNATPFAQQPRENNRNNLDWEQLDLESLPSTFIPRTNYQPLVGSAEFTSRHAMWDGAAYTTRFREVHRQMIGSTLVRTIQSALVPPKVAIVGSLAAIAGSDNTATVEWSGLMSSIPYDYLIKVNGAANLKKNLTDRLAFPKMHPQLSSPKFLMV